MGFSRKDGCGCDDGFFGGNGCEWIIWIIIIIIVLCCLCG